MLTLYRRHGSSALTQPLEDPDTPLSHPDSDPEPEPAPGGDSPFMPEQPPGPDQEPAPERT